MDGEGALMDEPRVEKVKEKMIKCKTYIVPGKDSIVIELIKYLASSYKLYKKK